MAKTTWYWQYLAFQKIDKFIKNHHWSQEQIINASTIFARFCNKFRVCEASQQTADLSSCNQEYPGYTLALNYLKNDTVSILLKPCVHRRLMINQKIIKKNFLYYDFDDKYLTLDITDKTTIYQNKSRTALLRCLAHFDPMKEHQGLYLYGSSTKGKTYIFMAYAVYLAKKYSQMKIAFVNTAHLINTVRQEQNQRSATSRPLLLDILKTADILFIDDLGVSKWSSWVRDYLFYYLFNFCLLNKKIVFLNSNLSLSELQKKLLQDDHSGNNKFTEISINRIITRINRLVSQEILLQ